MTRFNGWVAQTVIHQQLARERARTLALAVYCLDSTATLTVCNKRGVAAGVIVYSSSEISW